MKSPFLILNKSTGLDPRFKRTYPLKHLRKWTDYRVLRLARQCFCLFQARRQVVGYENSAPPAMPISIGSCF